VGTGLPLAHSGEEAPLVLPTCDAEDIDSLKAPPAR
jgi:hypothetical protein